MTYKKGWLLLRFFESDIKNDVSKCGNIIEEIINDGELKE